MAAIRTQREIRQRAPWWLFALLAVNFGLMTYDARDAETKQRKIRSLAQTIMYPLQRSTSSSADSVSGFFGRFSELRRAAAENEQLRKQVQEMQTELRDTRERAAEATRLEQLLKLSQNSQYGSIAAHVIARDPSMWFDGITIDKGRWAGVEMNMPVVTPSGVVGRVISTSPLSSQVMLVTDERSGVGGVVGQLNQSTAMGPIKGMGESGLLDMRYVSGLEKVQVGDMVSTTGLDGVYPPGYNVGQVIEVRLGSATQALLIRIRPSAGLERVKEVAVLTYRPPPRVEPDQALPNVDKKSK